MDVNNTIEKKPKISIIDLIKAHPRTAQRLTRAQIWGQGIGTFEEDVSVVDSWLELLAPPMRAKPRSYSEDIASLSRLLSDISDALDEGTLTDDEAEAVVKAALIAFMSNRLNNAARFIFSPRRGHWFIAAGEGRYGER